jgi:hypothetical protein
MEGRLVFLWCLLVAWACRVRCAATGVRVPLPGRGNPGDPCSVYGWDLCFYFVAVAKTMEGSEIMECHLIPVLPRCTLGVRFAGICHRQQVNKPLAGACRCDTTRRLPHPRPHHPMHGGGCGVSWPMAPAAYSSTACCAPHPRALWRGQATFLIAVPSPWLCCVLERCDLDASYSTSARALAPLPGHRAPTCCVLGV